MRFYILVAMVVAVAMAQNATAPCQVGCTFSPHYWSAHHSHPAWKALEQETLCDGTAHDALVNGGTAGEDDLGHEAAAQVIAAQLNLAVAQCPSAAPSFLLGVAMSLSQGCIGMTVDREQLDNLTLWNAGQYPGGPCHCTNLECARYVAPQAVIDKEMAAIEELSSTDVGFLVWAIVATVIAVVLALVVLVLLLRADWNTWSWMRILSPVGDDEPADMAKLAPSSDVNL